MGNVIKKKATKQPAKRTPKRKPAPVDDMAAFLAQGRPVVTDSIAYVLRACKADMSSQNNFVWPTDGKVEAPDWQPTDACGNGLHGWLWGEGDITACGWWENPEAKWLVCAVWKDDCVDLTRKVKFPRAWVVFCGPNRDAGQRIVDLGAKGAVIYGTSTSGYGGTSTSGTRGTSTSGDGGTSTSGYGGTSTSGDGGTSTSGDGGTSTSGDGGTSTSGDGGTSTSGEDGALAILRWNGKWWKYARASVGENGIEPNVPYRLDAAGNFVRADGVQ